MSEGLLGAIPRPGFETKLCLMSLVSLAGPAYLSMYIVDTHTNLSGLFGALASWAIWFPLTAVVGIFGIMLISIWAWDASSDRGKQVGAEMKAEGYDAGASALIATMVFDELDEMDHVEVVDDR